MFGLLLVDSLRAPFRDPAWARKLLIGGFLGAIPIVNLVAWGYLYRVFINGLNGQHPLELPDWSDWRNYLAAGFWLLLIVLGYLVITTIGLTAIVSLAGISPTSDIPEEQASFLLVVFGSLVVVYSCFPIVFTRFAEEQRLWTAFDPWMLWADIRLLIRWEYVQGCFLLFGFFLAGNSLFGLVPIVGLGVFSFVLFYVLVGFAHTFGLWIGRVKELAEERDRQSGDEV